MIDKYGIGCNGVDFVVGRYFFQLIVKYTQFRVYFQLFAEFHFFQLPFAFNFLVGRANNSDSGSTGGYFVPFFTSGNNGNFIITRVVVLVL